MSDGNLAEILQGFLHFLFHTFLGTRLLLLGGVIAIVVLVSKRSHHIARFLGNTLLWGGIATAVVSVWALCTTYDFTWLAIMLLSLIPTFAGRTILDSYGQAPMQAVQQQQPMPAPVPVAPFRSVGNASADDISGPFGGKRRFPSLDDQETYD